MALDGWDALEAVWSGLFILCLVPQFVRTVQRGRANDVSLAFLVLVLVASGMAMVWSVHESNYFYAVSLVGNLVVWGTVAYYRVRPRSVPVSA